MSIFDKIFLPPAERARRRAAELGIYTAVIAHKNTRVVKCSDNTVHIGPNEKPGQTGTWYRPKQRAEPMPANPLKRLLPRIRKERGEVGTLIIPPSLEECGGFVFRDADIFPPTEQPKDETK